MSTVVSAKPSIVVITPAYNVEAWIEETMRSVLAQSHRQLRYVVVDDGSSDRTLAIARSIARGDARVTVITQPNRGVSAARNAGLAATESELVSFIDGDDLWEPTFLKVQLAQLRAQPASCAGTFCWSNMISETGALVGDFQPIAGKHTLRMFFEGSVLRPMAARCSSSASPSLPMERSTRDSPAPRMPSSGIGSSHAVACRFIAVRSRS